MFQGGVMLCKNYHRLENETVGMLNKNMTDWLQFMKKENIF